MVFLDKAYDARQQFAAATGFKPVLVTDTYRDGRGWHVLMDVLESGPIAGGVEVLSFFEVLLDDEGKMVNFRRQRRNFYGEPAA